MTNAVVLENLCVKRDRLTILDQVTATVEAGSVTAIIGPNGSGKSTLLKAILGLIPSTGRLELHSRRGPGQPMMGYVPQSLEFDRGQPITVMDFMLLSRQRRPLWFGRNATLQVRAMACLDRVAAKGLAAKRLGVLSGGELQRVQLALALQNEPEILILDEPVSGVDVVGEQLFCDILETIRQESEMTLIMVSHDLSVVSKHATHVICLSNGKVQCQGSTPESLTAETLQHVYGPHMGIYAHHGAGAHGHAHGDDCGCHHPQEQPILLTLPEKEK